MSFDLTTTFDFDEACITELASDEAMFDALMPVAEEIAALGAANAPRHLAATVTILGTEVDDDGCVIYVGSDNSFAHLWEFGSINTATYGFMRAAGSSVADQFVES